MENGAARRGEIWRLRVKPPACYAGAAGAKALIEDVSATSIYVLYESGLRESFPPGRFAGLFEPTDRAGDQRLLPSVLYAGQHDKASVSAG
jgi:hypothetical protein